MPERKILRELRRELKMRQHYLIASLHSTYPIFTAGDGVTRTICGLALPSPSALTGASHPQKRSHTQTRTHTRTPTHTQTHSPTLNPTLTGASHPQNVDPALEPYNLHPRTLNPIVFPRLA